MNKTEYKKLKKRIRYVMIFFITALVISGITAFPIEWELEIARNIIGESDSYISIWLAKVREGVHYTGAEYPFIFYGTDWLAFAHIVIAVAFIGVINDPVRNIWVLEFGMIACILVIPLALIAGSVREIPVFWRLIDCSFGGFGIIPILICHKWTRKISK